MSKVYIQTDTQGRVINCEGGYTTPADLTGWTEIDEGEGDRYNLCQSHYFAGGLYTEDGIPRYKYVDGACTPRSDAEIAADLAALPPAPPTEAERITAMEDAICEIDEAHAASVAAIEGALCETETDNGGTV